METTTSIRKRRLLYSKRKSWLKCFFQLRKAFSNSDVEEQQPQCISEKIEWIARIYLFIHSFKRRRHLRHSRSACPSRKRRFTVKHSVLMALLFEKCYFFSLFISLLQLKWPCNALFFLFPYFFLFISCYHRRRRRSLLVEFSNSSPVSLVFFSPRLRRTQNKIKPA